MYTLILQLADKLQLSSIKDRVWQIQPCSATKEFGVQVNTMLLLLEQTSMLKSYYVNSCISLCCMQIKEVTFLFCHSHRRGLSGSVRMFHPNRSNDQATVMATRSLSMTDIPTTKLTA